MRLRQIGSLIDPNQLKKTLVTDSAAIYSMLDLLLYVEEGFILRQVSRREAAGAYLIGKEMVNKVPPKELSLKTICP